MQYIYAWTAHPKKGGKLQKGIPKYANGNGWQPIFDEDNRPIYKKLEPGDYGYEYQNNAG